MMSHFAPSTEQYGQQSDSVIDLLSKDMLPINYNACLHILLQALTDSDKLLLHTIYPHLPKALPPYSIIRFTHIKKGQVCSSSLLLSLQTPLSISIWSEQLLFARNPPCASVSILSSAYSPNCLVSTLVKTLATQLPRVIPLLTIFASQFRVSTFMQWHNIDFSPFWGHILFCYSEVHQLGQSLHHSKSAVIIPSFHLECHLNLHGAFPFCRYLILAATLISHTCSVHFLLSSILYTVNTFGL